MKKDFKGLKVCRVVGIVILLVGIYLLVSGLLTESVSMQHPDWFELSSKKTTSLMFSIPVIIIGVVCTFVIPKGFSGMVKNGNKVFDVLNNNLETVFKQSVFPFENNEETFCEYCATSLEGKTTCPNCGAKIKKNNEENLGG